MPATAGEAELEIGPDGLGLKAALHGDPKPEFGRLKRATAYSDTMDPGGSTNTAIRLNGQDQMLVYTLPEELDEDYSVAVWFRLLALPEGRVGQIFSAWTKNMDDPLRLTIEGGKLYARIEAQADYSSKGLMVERNVWHHLAAVKSGATLILYLDGQARERMAVPQFLGTTSRTCALGGNPNFSGNEFLSADFADLNVFYRALAEAEVHRLAKSSKVGRDSVEP